MNGPTGIDPETALAARAFLARIQAQYDLSRAILFGSRARHDHHAHSDVDIALLLRGHPGRFLTTKLEMADIAYDVLLETGIRVQPFPIWEDEWVHTEDYPNPRLLQNIEREGMHCAQAPIADRRAWRVALHSILAKEMHMGMQELAALALKLEPAERLDLVDRVLHSLDKPDPEIDRVWLEEAERRLAAYRAGKVNGISAEEIFGAF
jgi:putative addiction module component (TIGR02574 family)